MSKIGYGILVGIIIVVVIILAIKPKKEQPIDITTDEVIVETSDTSVSTPRKRVTPQPTQDTSVSSAHDQELFGDTSNIIEQTTTNDDSLTSVFSNTGAQSLSDFEYGF